MILGKAILYNKFKIIKRNIGFIDKVMFLGGGLCDSGPAGRAGRFTLCVCPVHYSLMHHENPKK